MSILVVGDGPRDQLALPEIVRNLLGLKVVTRYDDLHKVIYLKEKGSANVRKVKYLTRRARSNGFLVLAIVVDRDKCRRRERLGDLHEGRDEVRRSSPPFPTALGEADPHFDVWLLDDVVAVREGLGLSGDVEVPNAVSVVSPKEILAKLIRECPRNHTEASDFLGEFLDA
jgi:hypothetical protein